MGRGPPRNAGLPAIAAGAALPNDFIAPEAAATASNLPTACRTPRSSACSRCWIRQSRCWIRQSPPLPTITLLPTPPLPPPLLSAVSRISRCPRCFSTSACDSPCADDAPRSRIGSFTSAGGGAWVAGAAGVYGGRRYVASSETAHSLGTRERPRISCAQRAMAHERSLPATMSSCTCCSTN